MGGRRIFIVEDERIVALDLQHRLTRLGHEVVASVASGDEALRLIEGADLDLVLTDIRLGGDIDGIALAEAIQGRYGLPVIFLTAYSDDQTLARVKATSACGFIIKPFTDDELQATIDISLHEHERKARRERLEASSRQAEKLESISAMAGGLAHELNNQLMAIQGNTALALVNQPFDAQDARGYLQNILTACQRSSAVMKQLLTCAGMVKGEFKPVRLSEIVSSLLPSLKKALPENAELRAKLAENLPPVNGDAVQLKQLLTILVANAGEAVKDKGGVVQLETGPDETAEDHHHDDYEIILRNRPFTRGPRCYLSIIDNGRGMNEETRARLFDPFFTTKGVGRGLGLSAALGIVKNHEGDILVKSSPGSGTTVRIVFACGAPKKTN